MEGGASSGGRGRGLERRPDWAGLAAPPPDPTAVRRRNPSAAPLGSYLVDTERARGPRREARARGGAPGKDQER